VTKFVHSETMYKLILKVNNEQMHISCTYVVSTIYRLNTQQTQTCHAN